ncbi:tetratricopeptide repeat protein [Nocardia sp. NPDC019395]|uniref:tetratricopeptide repeat protein n=1 Tax=Nocardia sp. NPDC019395 TaxID=3154686 RepID=UPI00340F1B07
MEREQVFGVEGTGRGTGYLLAPRLVLTSAHLVDAVGDRATLYRPGRHGTFTGIVAWRGTPGGRDDAALIHLDDVAWTPPELTVTVWGRTVTSMTGIVCRSWGLPAFVQREQRPPELEQPSGTINPGDRDVADRYVFHLDTAPPTSIDGALSPWAGMSGAAVFSGQLLIGVIAVDAAYRQHAGLEVVPAYALLRDSDFRATVEQIAGSEYLRCEAVELQDLMDRQSPLHISRSVRTPASLLTARRAVVAFRGRAELLEQLGTWAQEPGLGMWLLHGRGGQGKTRVAHHFGELCTAQGWTVLWLNPNVTANELTTLSAVRQRLLVIIDYAEIRSGQVSELLTCLAPVSARGQVKVMLLARTAGAWWSQLAIQATDTVAEIIDHTIVHSLSPLDETAEQRQQTYRAAVRQFRKALPSLQRRYHLDPPLEVPLPDPSVTLDGGLSVLGVLMQALVDLLDATTAAHVTGPTGRSLEERVLDHERRYWTMSAQARGLIPQFPDDTLADIVAATVVLAPTDSLHVASAITRVPDLGDQPQLTISKVRDWLMSLYPGEGLVTFGGLAPDRLAEHLVGRLLIDTERPCVIDSVAPEVDADEAEHLLTVCVRAAAHPALAPTAGEHLTQLCVGTAATLMPAALRVAPTVEHPAPLVRALELLATDSDTSLALLIQLSTLLPRETQVLARPAAVLCRAVRDRLRAAEDTTVEGQRTLAEAARDLATRLISIGELLDASDAASEAVDILRRLCAQHPDSVSLVLVDSLVVQASVLNDLRHREQALSAVMEAEAILRQIHDTDVDAHRARLASCRYNRARAEYELGNLPAALHAATDAEQMFRTMAEQQHPAASPASLANCLTIRSAMLSAAGHTEDAVAVGAEAVARYRVLAEHDPDSSRANLASCLNNFAFCLAKTELFEDAVAASAEAVEIQRSIAAENPAALPHLASSLNNLARHLDAAGRPEEAHAAAHEVVATYRRLVQQHPQVHLPVLAGALYELSMRHATAEQPRQALTTGIESAQIGLQVTTEDPGQYLSFLPMLLDNLNSQLHELGHESDLYASADLELTAIKQRLSDDTDAALTDLEIFLHDLPSHDTDRRPECRTT